MKLTFKVTSGAVDIQFKIYEEKRFKEYKSDLRAKG